MPKIIPKPKNGDTDKLLNKIRVAYCGVPEGFQGFPINDSILENIAEAKIPMTPTSIRGLKILMINEHWRALDDLQDNKLTESIKALEKYVR